MQTTSSIRGALSPQASASEPPSLAALPTATYEEFLHDITDDPRLRVVLSTRIFSSKNSLVTMATYMASILWGGLYYVRNLASRLIERLDHHFLSLPGNGAYFDCKVSKILLDRSQKVCAVRLADGSELNARSIVLSCDLTRAVDTMLPDCETKDYLSSVLKGAGTSLSAVVAVFVMKPSFASQLGPFSRTARFFISSSEDLFSTFRARESGLFDDSCLKLTFDFVSSSTGPLETLPCVYVEVDSPFGACPVHSSRWIESLIARLDPLFPGFAEFVLHQEIFSPDSLVELSQSRNGACSGWADDFDQAADLERNLSRMHILVAGQWSRYGTGLPMLEQSAHAVATRLTAVRR